MGHSQFSRSFIESFDIHQAIASALSRLRASGKRPALAYVVSILRQSHPEITLAPAELEAAIMQAAADGGVQIRAEESRATAA
jgi:hypothetical protein